MHPILLPREWGISFPDPAPEGPLPLLGRTYAELQRRWRAGTNWLLGQWCEEEGAFYGFYRVRERTFAPPQTVNLIAPLQLLAAYDETPADAALLERARRACDFLERRLAETHPMSVVQGGVRDAERDELWVKYAAEYALLNAALYRRIGDGEYLDRAVRSGRFLVQSRRHRFAPVYDRQRRRWVPRGWRSFGRAILALLALGELTGEEAWQEEAIRFGEFGLGLQAPGGGFYLIDGEYYNTDLAADELRALVLLHRVTGDRRFLESACRFADFHLRLQRPDGAWPLTLDREGHVVCPTVGPGDVPHIGLGLLTVHLATGEARYLEAAARAVLYSLRVQVDKEEPYGRDERARGGFWSWDPPYDFTMSGDQSTFHVRGLMFLATFLAGAWGSAPTPASAR